MVKHRVNNSAKDSKEIRKVNEFERRKKEAELINKIKRSVPFFKRNAKCNKKEFLRTITGYVKLFHSKYIMIVLYPSIDVIFFL